MLAVQGADMVYVSGLARNVVQGAYQLSPLDHTAMLTCLNPKVRIVLCMVQAVTYLSQRALRRAG